MGVVVRLEWADREPAAKHNYRDPAKIILFPGVRFERLEGNLADWTLPVRNVDRLLPDS